MSLDKADSELPPKSVKKVNSKIIDPSLLLENRRESDFKSIKMTMNTSKGEESALKDTDGLMRSSMAEQEDDDDMDKNKKNRMIPKAPKSIVESIRTLDKQS